MTNGRTNSEQKINLQYWRASLAEISLLHPQVKEPALEQIVADIGERLMIAL